MSTVVLLITIVMVAVITNNVSYCISNISGNVSVILVVLGRKLIIEKKKEMGE